MRYKEIDINIKAIPDKEDEALLNQLMGAKGVTVSDTDTEKKSDANADNPGKVDSDDPNTVPSVFESTGHKRCDRAKRCYLAKDNGFCLAAELE